MPEPDAWPSMIAEAKTLIRESLPGFEAFLEVHEVIGEMMGRRNPEWSTYIADTHQARNQFGDDYVLLAGEMAWVVGEAIQELKAASEVRELAEDEAPTVRILGGHLQYGTLTTPDYRLPRRISVTPRGVQQRRFVEATGIRWDHVRRLLDEARRAYLSGLAVVSLVGARIVTEEAVRAALEDLGVVEVDQPSRPWEREEMLFGKDYLLNAVAAFHPLDHTSTRAVVSGTRSYGNEVAHSGLADDAHLNELFISILPRALQSLSAAVGALL